MRRSSSGPVVITGGWEVPTKQGGGVTSQHSSMLGWTRCSGCDETSLRAPGSPLIGRSSSSCSSSSWVLRYGPRKHSKSDDGSSDEPALTDALIAPPASDLAGVELMLPGGESLESLGSSAGSGSTSMDTGTGAVSQHAATASMPTSPLSTTVVHQPRNNYQLVAYSTCRIWARFGFHAIVHSVRESKIRTKTLVLEPNYPDKYRNGFPKLHNTNYRTLQYT